VPQGEEDFFSDLKRHLETSEGENKFFELVTSALGGKAIVAYCITEVIPGGKGAILDALVATEGRVYGFTLFKGRSSETVFNIRDLVGITTDFGDGIVTVKFIASNSTSFQISENLGSEAGIIAFREAIERRWP